MSHYLKAVCTAILYIIAITIVLQVVAVMRGVPLEIGAVALVVAGVALIRVYERR